MFHRLKGRCALPVLGVLALCLAPALAHAQGRCGGSRFSTGGQQGSALRTANAFQQSSLNTLPLGSSLTTLQQQSLQLAALQQQQNALLLAALQQQQQSALLANALQQQQLQNAQLTALLLQQQASQLRTNGR